MGQSAVSCGQLQRRVRRADIPFFPTSSPSSSVAWGGVCPATDSTMVLECEGGKFLIFDYGNLTNPPKQKPKDDNTEAGDDDLF